MADSDYAGFEVRRSNWQRMMPLQRAASATSEVHDEAERRMLAFRDRVRRWFSPEAMANVEPDVPEVIGARTPIHPRGMRRFRGTR